MALAIASAIASSAGYALAEDKREPEDSMFPSSYETIVDILTPLDRLIVGGANRLFGLRSGTREVVDINFQENQIRETSFGAGVISASVSSEGDGRILYFILTENQFESDFDISLFSEEHSIESGSFGQARERENYSFDFPDDFAKPKLLQLEDQLVLWDRNPERPHGFYRVFTPGGLFGADDFDVLPKMYPYELLRVGSNRFALALHPWEDQISMIEVSVGVPEDTSYLRGLWFSEPTDLAIFVPAEIHGGTGDVVLANEHDQLLTILSVEIGDVPRISQPLQIRFEIPESAADRDTQPLLAADRSLSTILIGFRGSDQLQVFRRSRGGLEQLNPIRAKFPLADIAVLHERSINTPEVFAFLRDDGQQVHLATTNMLAKDKIDHYTGGDGTGLEIVDKGDIGTVQRVLAALGYRVGAIDGKTGALTRAAIRAFQYDNDLKPSGEVDAQTLSVLNTQISNIRSSGDSDDTNVEAYTNFLSQAVPEVEASRLLQLGRSHGSPSHPCFGLNSLPPRHLWENSIVLARVLRHLEVDFGLDMRIMSAFRTPSYNHCIKVVPDSRHLDFAAMDLRVRDPELEDKEALEVLSDALKEIAIIDSIPLVIRPIKRSVHVELELANQDPRADDGTGAVTRPTVYLRFADGGPALAEELSRRLSEQGFVMPGAEMHKGAFGRREVRFFHEGDREIAEELANATEMSLKKMPITSQEEVRIVDMTNEPGRKPDLRALELWLSF